MFLQEATRRRSIVAELMILREVHETRIAALEIALAEMQRRLLPQVQLPEMLSVNEVAALIGRSPQAVRAMCRVRSLGTRDEQGRHLIEKGKLRDYIFARFGSLPAGLR